MEPNINELRTKINRRDLKVKNLKINYHSKMLNLQIIHNEHLKN